MNAGTVYLVGAGPGAADLLTLRAARLLGEAGIVLHDALVPRDILELISGRRIPVGKRSGRLSTAQAFINKQLFDAAQTHRVVVRLKGGDPMLFGRAHEEIAFLRRRRIRVEVVPGVTAAAAASAELQVSLTRRGAARSVSFVTPRVGKGEAPSSWLEAARSADTVAIYMGASEAARIAADLIAAGRSARTPVVVVQNASLPDSRQLVGTLGTLPALAQALADGPTLILLGETYRELAQSVLPLATPAAPRRSSGSR